MRDKAAICFSLSIYLFAYSAFVIAALNAA